jgi:hypothetical protein
MPDTSPRCRWAARCLGAVLGMLGPSAAGQFPTVADSGQGLVSLSSGTTAATELSGITWLGGTNYLAVGDNGAQAIWRLTVGVDATTGRITNGAYRAEAFAGPVRIAVTATRAVPGKFVSPAPGVEPRPKTEQFIPRRYNEKTELAAEIPVGGIRGLDFALTLTPDAGLGTASAADRP